MQANPLNYRGSIRQPQSGFQSSGGGDKICKEAGANAVKPQIYTKDTLTTSIAIIIISESVKGDTVEMGSCWLKQIFDNNIPITKDLIKM